MEAGPKIWARNCHHPTKPGSQVSEETRRTASSNLASRAFAANFRLQLGTSLETNGSRYATKHTCFCTTSCKISEQSTRRAGEAAARAVRRSAANTAKRLKQVLFTNVATLVFVVAGTNISLLMVPQTIPHRTGDKRQDSAMAVISPFGLMKQAFAPAMIRLPFEPTHPHASRDFKKRITSSEGQLNPCTWLNRERVCRRKDLREQHRVSLIRTCQSIYEVSPQF